MSSDDTFLVPATAASAPIATEMPCGHIFWGDAPKDCPVCADIKAAEVGTFAQVPLTQGRFAIVDAEDYKMISKYKWYAHKRYYVWYAESTTRVLSMHRLIMGAKEGQILDHINMNGLDNRKVNLRFVTPSQSNMNRRGFSKHGYKGICYDKRCKQRPWQARIKINGKIKSLGMYGTALEAAMAYDEFAMSNPDLCIKTNFQVEAE